jgi:TonB family protein
MLKTATDFLPSSSAGLPLALGGSLLLHLGLLFGVPTMAPAVPGTAPSLSVRLVSAAQAAAHVATQPTTPSATQPRPEQRRLRHHAGKVAEMQTQAALSAVRPASTATPHEVSAQPRIATSQTEHAATVYYDGTQLDTPPHLLGEVQQIYPARARTADIQGSVTLSLLIDEHGEVNKVSVLDAQPPGYFEHAALDMLRNQRFTPALLHNQPVKSRWRTIVRYRLQS